MSEIRSPKTEAECFQLIELGARMHGESRFKKYDYDRAKLRTYIPAFLDHPDWFAMAAWQDGEPFAMILATVHEHYFSSLRSANDMLIFAAPDKRGGFAIKRLMNAFEAWARTRDVDMMIVGTLADINTPTALRFFKGCGFKDSGALLVKEL